MDTVILDNLSFNIDIDRLLNILRIDEDDDDAEKIKHLVNSAKAVARPKVMYKISDIESREEDYVVVDGIKLKSRMLSSKLEYVNKVFPFIVTCGKELDNWSSSIADPFENYWADSIKEQILYSSIEEFYTLISKNLPDKSISTMSPGTTEDWSMDGQKGVFTILGSVQDAIGVELTSSGLMYPIKSVSGIIYYYI